MQIQPRPYNQVLETSPEGLPVGGTVWFHTLMPSKLQGCDFCWLKSAEEKSLTFTDTLVTHAAS